MIYECDQCSASLPAGAEACPHCGAAFGEVVPADAIVPRRGFSAVNSLEPAQPLSLFVQPLPPFVYDDPLVSNKATEALKNEVVVLKKEVVTLTNRLVVLEMASRENKRRFLDHVDHVKEALRFIQPAVRE